MAFNDPNQFKLLLLNFIKMVSSSDYDQYLARRAASLIRENFGERGVTNLLVVKWGKRWNRTLGHIKTLENKDFGSEIEINSLFKNPDVPEYVLDYVLMHELVHYFQGFGSNHEKKSKHPHKGGVVDKELDRLGWKEIREKGEAWIKANWRDTLVKYGAVKRPRKVKVLTPKKFIMSWKRLFD